MGNNINDIKKFIGNNIPLKTNNINKLKDGIKNSKETDKNEQMQQTENKSNELLEKNSPSEILGRVQVENKKSKSVNDNFEKDMAFLEKQYKTVSYANNFFDECLNNGYSYHVSSLLAQQFVKEIS